MGLTARPCIYVDANIVIGLIESHHPAIVHFLDQLRNRNGVMCTSELTLSEVLVAPLREGNVALVNDYEDFLKDGYGVSMIPVDRAVLRQSAELRARFGSKTPDSIHVASAMTFGCRLILSADKRLRTPENLFRIGVEEWQKLDEFP